jgi:hypothetical protein
MTLDPYTVTLADTLMDILGSALSIKPGPARRIHAVCQRVSMLAIR